MLQIVPIVTGRPSGCAAACFAAGALPGHELSLAAHRAPIPEDEPIPGEEPEPDEDPVPHPDPVIREPDDASSPPMRAATARPRDFAYNNLGA